MTFRELELEIWVSNGFDRRCIEGALANAKTLAVDPNTEIPPEHLPEFRRKMAEVIGGTIRDFSQNRRN